LIENRPDMPLRGLDLPTEVHAFRITADQHQEGEEKEKHALANVFKHELQACEEEAERDIVDPLGIE